MREKNRRSQSGRGKNMWKRAAFGILLSAAVCCAGCGGDESFSISMSTSDYRADKSYESSGGYAGESSEIKNAVSAPMAERTDGGSMTADIINGSSGGGDQYLGQKLIRKVNLSVETKEFDVLMPALNARIRQLGGYIENMETYNGSGYSDRRGSRYAHLTIRIPREQTDGFLETVSDISSIVRRSESAEDVTFDYVDIESRRNTLRTEQERLLIFLEKAQSIEEIITIEDRLSNVRYQLESMESRLRAIDNQVDYNTINMDISEVRELTPQAELTVWERISAGFKDSLGDIGDGAVDFGVWFLVNIPYFVIWAAVIGAGALAIRKLVKKWKKKKEALKETPKEQDR